MRRIVALLVLLAVALGVGVAVTRASFVTSERQISIGAHEATLRPDFSGHAVFDLGPLLPQVRIPSDAPLGIGAWINLGDSEVESLDELVARDAVIASQPQGEIAAVGAAIGSIWWSSVARGAGAALLLTTVVLVGWRALGPIRRAEIVRGLRRPTRRGLATGAAGAIATVSALALLFAPGRTDGGPVVAWVPIHQVFPTLPADPVLDRLELSDGTATSGGQALIEGALKTYRESVSFYGVLAEAASDIEVRTPLEGETTALVVTDRHDNVGMDPVARAVADAAGARLLIDLGDDTSNGARWEEFSINSLADAFDGFDVVAVAGNHDTGRVIPDAMRRAGFTVLDGEPVEVAGIRFLGASDPRSSGLTAGYTGDETDNIDAIRRQDEDLLTAACDDGEVAVIAVHSPSSAKRVAASGCADLILSGHLHRQVGPEVLVGPNGVPTVTLSTGSTGGAVYAFALGSKLRRDAQVTIVTFSAEGRPVGLQPVTFKPGGAIEVADYFDFTAIEITDTDEE